MNDTEVSTVEQSINEIDASIVELQQQKTEIELLIETLTRTKFNLSKLLPHDKRLERLFK